MLFFIKVAVNQKNNSPDQLWDIWEEEAEVTLKALERKKIVSAYKIAGQKKVVLIYDASSHDELDKVFMAGLPLSEFIEIEEMLPIRPYEDFAKDIQKRWK
ncbi:muconolactone Delta-isomerase family protein [Mesobacillus subterraneus]|uniref:muconolactone Delta-isomerase family protein n=1 Tax=Mesobacillus subterraneus TaxID=285983 RepID=UPI00273FA454|nr:muconolactone Delta-isomerase family protein [Mesobacillus subterraneus]WLR57338.1 muconolactone Delta-isomerase family protein [Mesobacillus subterraneus]